VSYHSRVSPEEMRKTKRNPSVRVIRDRGFPSATYPIPPWLMFVNNLLRYYMAMMKLRASV
jgi:hypothetical protein